MDNNNGVSSMVFEEKCICELCECGLHRCSHVASIRLGHEQEVGLSEYNSKFTGEFGEAAKNLRPPAVSDSLGLSIAPFGSSAEARTPDSTHRAEFKAWPLQKIYAVRPIEELNKSTATFDATSIHQSDFTRKNLALEPIASRKSQAISSQWQPGANTEPFVGISTQKADFNKKIQVKPTLPYRPLSEVEKIKVPLDATTTHQQDYRVFKISTPPSTFKPQDQSRYFSAEPFTATTEHRANFNKKIIQPILTERPRAAMSYYRPSSQPMDLKSTYQEGYTDKKDLITKVEPFRHRDQLSIAKDLPFTASTIQRDEYTVKRLKICPAELVLTRRDRSYKRAGFKNGHVLYRRVVSASIPDAVRYRHMSPIQG